MSDEVYPVLRGLTWPVRRKPMFNTRIQRAVDMTEARASFAQYPVYDVTLSYDVLEISTQEYTSLAGFFLARHGSFDSFLFTDVLDSHANAQLLATTDGTTANYPLRRALGAFTEPVQNLHNAPTVLLGGNVVANYTLSALGVILFNTPPTANSQLRWTGDYYFRARFIADEMEFDQFMTDFVSNGQVQLKMSLQRKI